jgi:predicted nucleic acid-binding protein
MKLVVDANVIFACLIKQGWLFDFIHLLPKRNFELYSPEYILEETNGRIDRLMSFSGLSKTELKYLIKLLFKNIKVVSKKKYEMFSNEAQKLLPGHSKDIPYFALALSLNSAIWSNEKRFKQQSCVEIFSTDELKLLI